MTTFLLDGRPLPIVLPPSMSVNVPTPSSNAAAAVEDLLLGSLQHPRVRLKRELRLKVRRGDGKVRITWDAADVAAEAESFPRAVDRFRRTVAETFLRLQEAGSLPDVFSKAMREGRA